VRFACTAFTCGATTFRAHLKKPVAAMARRAAAVARSDERIHVVGAMSYCVIFHGGRPVCISLPMSKVKGGADLLDTRGAVSEILLGHRRALERLRSSG
jgi:hypothetical protein